MVAGVPACTVMLCPPPFQYVENPELERWGLEPMMVLQQLMSGLAHLHSLHIGRPRPCPALCLPRRHPGPTLHPGTAFPTSALNSAGSALFWSQCTGT